MTIHAVVVPCDETRPLICQEIPEDMDDPLEGLTTELNSDLKVEDVRQTLLLRTSSSSSDAGLVAYNVAVSEDQMLGIKNVRATRLALACGKFSLKLHGNVLLVRCSFSSRANLSTDEVFGACCISFDLRPDIQKEMFESTSYIEQYDYQTPPSIPDWLGNALRNNYHDQVVLDKLANVMMEGIVDENQSDSEGDNDSSSDSSSISVDKNTGTEFETNENLTKRQFVTKVPLCLHCRRPASNLCREC